MQQRKLTIASHLYDPDEDDRNESHLLALIKHMSLTLDELWDWLLSRQPEQVLQAYQDLDAESQAAVLDHLRRMAGEPGWHPEQVASAQAALTILEGRNSTDGLKTD